MSRSIYNGHDGIKAVVGLRVRMHINKDNVNPKNNRTFAEPGIITKVEQNNCYVEWLDGETGRYMCGGIAELMLYEYDNIIDEIEKNLNKLEEKLCQKEDI